MTLLSNDPPALGGEIETLEPPRYEASPIADVALAEDVPEVSLDRVRTNEKVIRDLSIRATFDHQPHDIHLTDRERPSSKSQRDIPSWRPDIANIIRVHSSVNIFT
jgi:hypothetical protein